MSDSKEEHRKAFVRRVREAREGVGLTQTDMASLLGVSQPTYAKYETRNTMVPLYLIKRFCLACDVTIDWLVTGVGRIKGKRGALELARARIAAGEQHENNGQASCH